MILDQTAMRRIPLLAFGVLLLAAARADETSRRSPVVRAVERDGPAVVNISTERIVVQTLRDPFVDPFFEEFFGRVSPPARRVKTTSLGSGVLIDPDGYLVTNEHVTRKASRIHVTLADGTALEAELIAEDRAADLALCKVTAARPLPFVSLDAVADLMIGETVIALGNPFGLENSVTVGVVSAKNRSLMNEGRVAYRDLVQTDASINPGNSGGPLLNVDGELIGINAAVYSQAEGIGFAIPVSRVRRVLGEMLDPRRTGCGWLGLRVEAGRGSGLVVAEVEPEGPAAKAGIRTGDLVAALDGKERPAFFPYLKAMASRKPGETVTLGILREDTVLTVTLRAGIPPRPSAARLVRDRLGLSVQALTPGLAGRLELRITNGCIVTEVLPEGPAAAVGIETGDVLSRVGKTPVPDPEALGAALEGCEAGEEVALQVIRANQVYTTPIRLGR